MTAVLRADIPTQAQASDDGALVPCPVPFDDIPRPAWDRLLAATTGATPFSRWTFHRAWWDAYGATAHEQYLVCLSADALRRSGGDPLADPLAIRAIVPLMHRHAVEPDDVSTATVLRHGSVTEPLGLPPDAKVVFMGASYHADYATILAAPEDLDMAAAALADSLAAPADASHGDTPWDVVDLRRFGASDPAFPALEQAFRAAARRHDWDVRAEIEDVCPVVSVQSADWEAYLASLEKKARHEIRRKVRRAEAAGKVTYELAPQDASSVERFIALHQARWGDDGLFPDTEGGRRSRRFLHRLTELEAAEGDAAQLQLGVARVGERIIFATVAFDDGRTCFFYNAGVDPAARDLSPGATGTAAYLRERMTRGCRRFDFLRGNEPYKYEWGAVDEPIHRLVVARRVVG